MTITTEAPSTAAPQKSKHERRRPSLAAQRRKMTESAKIFEAVEARRLRKQIIVQGVKVAKEVTVIPVEDLSKLNIDERYQRVRIGQKVNALVAVLLAGGQVPDAIDVAERPDGSWWIVDGQQRFWAHIDANKPLKANVHKVDDYDAEVNLFIVLNSRVGLQPKTILKGWPGPIGQFIRKMNECDTSPLKGLIDFGTNGHLPIDGSTLAKCILLAVTGVEPNGDTATSLLPRLDSALRLPGAHAWAEAYVQLLAAAFGPSSRGGRLRVLPMLALAKVAHEKFAAAGRPIFPRTCGRMRLVNWNSVAPSNARQFRGLVEERIKKLWR